MVIVALNGGDPVLDHLHIGRVVVDHDAANQEDV